MEQGELASLIARLTGGAAWPTESTVRAAMSVALQSKKINTDINRQVFSSNAQEKVQILAAILLIRNQIDVDKN